MKPPETRPSLLVRIRDTGHRDAWQEFSDLYRPVILAVAERQGLERNDAEDPLPASLTGRVTCDRFLRPDAERRAFSNLAAEDCTKGDHQCVDSWPARESDRRRRDPRSPPVSSGPGKRDSDNRTGVPPRSLPHGSQSRPSRSRRINLGRVLEDVGTKRPANTSRIGIGEKHWKHLHGA